MSTVEPTPAPAHTAVRFPASWLLNHGAPAIRYRAAIEVARLPLAGDPAFAALPLTERSALRLATLQRFDGSWRGTLLDVPSSAADALTGVGTIAAAFHLAECCWDRETPPVVKARRILFRLLAEDEEPGQLYEFAADAGDARVARRRRRLLREAAGAVLARFGHESDPRLRGAAGRVLARVDAFLRSPAHDHPFVRIGNRHVLPEEASPPSLFALAMFAWMPRFRSENHPVFERLYGYLAAPLPRQESVQLAGERVLDEPYLVLGDPLPHRNAADADVPRALLWLELVGRLGFLRRNDAWSRVLDRYLDDADRDGLWRPRRGAAAPPLAADPLSWAVRLWEGELDGEDARAAVTTRLGIIARLAGRDIELA